MESRVLKPGLVAHDFQIPSNTGGKGDIFFIESSNNDYPVRIIGGRGSIGSLSYRFPASISELISIDAPVVVSGAYASRVGSVLLPLGYLRSGDTIISGRFHKSWMVDSVFCTDASGSKNSIFPTETFKRDLGPGYTDCAQTGPRLLENGGGGVESLDDGNSDREAYIRWSRIQLFICKADDNPNSPLGIGITSDRMALHTLDTILPKLRINGRRVCNNAVSLSNGISAGMLINGSLVAGSGTFLNTSALAFVRRGSRTSRKLK